MAYFPLVSCESERVKLETVRELSMKCAGCGLRIIHAMEKIMLIMMNKEISIKMKRRMKLELEFMELVGLLMGTGRVLVVRDSICWLCSVTAIVPAAELAAEC
jgi:hypothetical protein